MGDDGVTLQEQAKALGDPTRFAIFRHVAEASVPVGVAELTERLGLNHNAIRQHLAKLLAAGLVVEEQVPSGGRGRPRLVYHIDPTVESRWGVTGPYERLSVLLAELTRSGRSAVDVGRAASAGSVVVDADADPVARMVDAMARQGFAPEVTERGSQVEVVLTVCPFAAAAEVDPDTVCGLHLGLAQGFAEVTDGRVTVGDLVRHNPRKARCRLVLHVD